MTSLMTSADQTYICLSAAYIGFISGDSSIHTIWQVGGGISYGKCHVVLPFAFALALPLMLTLPSTATATATQTAALG